MRLGVALRHGQRARLRRFDCALDYGECIYSSVPQHTRRATPTARPIRAPAGRGLGRQRQHQPPLLPLASGEFCGYAPANKNGHPTLPSATTPPPTACTAGATRWAATTSPASTIAVCDKGTARPDVYGQSCSANCACASNNCGHGICLNARNSYAGYSDHSNGHVRARRRVQLGAMRPRPLQAQAHALPDGLQPWL